MESSLAPELSLPEHVTVALIIGRGNADAQEVSFIVAGQNSLAPITLRQQRQARRAPRTVEIGAARLTSGRERDSVKLSANVTVHCVRAPNRVRRQEAAGRESDAFEVNGRGLSRSPTRFSVAVSDSTVPAVGGFQVGDVMLQGVEVAGGDFAFLLAAQGQLRGPLRLACRRVLAWRNLLLQLLNLPLLGGNRVLLRGNRVFQFLDFA